MSVDLNQLAAHLPTAQREAVKQAYHKQATNSTTVFLLCFFLGWCGAHRFYLGQAGRGFVRLLVPLILVAVVVLGIALAWPASVIALAAIPLALIAVIWEILDLFRIDTEVHARNLKVAEELIANSLLADTSVEQAAADRLDNLVRQTYAQSTGAAQPQQAAASAEPALASVDAPAAEPAVEPAAAVSTEYVATTVNEISAQPDEARDAQLAAPSDWSTTESYTLDDSPTAEQTPGEAAALGAAAAGALYTEAVTHEHSVSGYATTDSVETTRTTSPEDAPDASAIPSWTEATAPTWPDHPPLEPETGDAFGGYYPETSAGGLDLTDRAGVPDAKPIADVGTAGASPLRVSLPAEAYVAAPVGDDDDLLVLLPDETSPAASEAGSVASAYGLASAQPQPEAYVPPTVPVITIPPAEASAPPMEESTTTPYHAVPMSTPAADETPTLVPEPEATHAEPQPDLSPPIEAAEGGALAASAIQPEYHESLPAQVDAGRHQMRRIRVVRQVKINDEVVEETSAEEFIEADADPEPVRARLQEMLRQQASGRMPSPGGEA